MRAVFFLGSLVLLLVPAALWGREVSILVEDTELGLPLEGAVIRSWDGKEYLCGADGSARIPVPDDREVQVRAAYPGYESGRLRIPPSGDRFSIGLRLSSVMEGRELVIEASRPGVSETRTGRSVAISGEALSRTAEIGVIEDVMTSVKLLPGVGYTGMFNAMPSIRGGEPGDLTASLDGFYIENPYHWGGGFSIFDPRMVESARLSHGVFSTRYGHTISGLLEVSSRKPSPTEFELELGLSSSAANLNLSVPLGGRGGVMVMGKLTYWDPFVWGAQALLGDTIPELNMVTTAPYIRSTALSANYRFGGDLEWNAAAFLGADGVGADYENAYDQGYLQGVSHMIFNWENTQGFALSGLTWNPRPPMALKASLGTGFLNMDLFGRITDHAAIWYTDIFREAYGKLFSNYFPPGWKPPYTYRIDRDQKVEFRSGVWNLQGRADFDWDLGAGFLFAGGLQGLYSRWEDYSYLEAYGEYRSSYFFGKEVFFGPGKTPVYPDPELGLYMGIPFTSPPMESGNGGLTGSAYSLLEYTSPDRRFGAEAGLRLDYFYLRGTDFTVQSYPPYDYRSLSPRLNLDYTLLKNRGILDSLSATLGSGFFSSLNDNVPNYRHGEDREIPFNRAWTSLGGLRAEFAGGFVFNIEGYFKYVFDRTYTRSYLPAGSSETRTEFRHDGEGRIWGFDLMLQRLESRFLDGWLSYSFNHARYRGEMESPDNSEKNRGIWYYPRFHRFHTLNLVLNLKPLRSFHIALRAGLASGQPKTKVGTPSAYPVQVYEENDGSFLGGSIPYQPVYGEDGNPLVIERWKRSSEYSDTERVDWSVPLDVKFSWFRTRGKIRSEVYLAFENLSSLFHKVKGNTSFNSYTGQEDTGDMSGVYELPIPMISLGFKWSY